MTAEHLWVSAAGCSIKNHADIRSHIIDKHVPCCRRLMRMLTGHFDARCWHSSMSPQQGTVKTSAPYCRNTAGSLLSTHCCSEPSGS